jgi:AraC family transcriptional regulator
MREQYYKWVYEAVLHIERNLGGPVDLPGVAARAGYSVFHFGRIFQGVTGETVMDYVRKRRLTEAARALVESDRRILEVALDWQYDSHEAFTRAFKRAYGVTPLAFRRRGIFVPLRAPLSLADIQPPGVRGVMMETRTVDLPAMRVVGLEYVGKNEDEEIPALWDVFLPRGSELQGPKSDCVCLGVCGDACEDGSFRYVAGCEVEADAPVPQGMVVFEVPAATYVVVTQRGPLFDEASGLRAVNAYIYREWLPKSGYQRAATPDLERYDERFAPGQQDSEMDVYVPIVRAGT